MFNPTNQWNVGQVLKKSGTNTYYWANESWGSADVNVKLFSLESRDDTDTAQEVLDWTLDWNMPIIKLNNWVYDVYYCLTSNTTDLNSSRLEFQVFMWPWQQSAGQQTGNYYYQMYEEFFIYYTEDTVTSTDRHRNELNKQWQWTQSEFDQLWTYENWVIYNILPNS